MVMRAGPLAAVRGFTVYRLPSQGRLLAFLLGATLLGLRVVVAQDPETGTKWDRGLLQLELNGVHVREGTLNKAWQRIAGEFGVRTVLLAQRDSPPETGTLAFDAERCTAAELLEAFVAAYPAYIYTQDTNTGVIWLHPKGNPYDTILAAKIKVEKDASAVPLATGVLDNLARFEALRVRRGGKGGDAMMNTFAYPVNFAKGTYSLKEILNACCIANPDRTFHISAAGAGMWQWVTPLTVLSSEGQRVPPGALLFWRTEADSAIPGAPTEAQLVDALASSDEHVRWAARNYLGMNLLRIPFHNLASRATSAEEAVWTAVGVLSVYLCTEARTALRLPETQAIENALKEGDWSRNPGLKALGAIELARVARDTKFLDAVATRPLSESAVASARYDMVRILRCSAFVRKRLSELAPDWAGFPKAAIDALGQTNIFSLP
jgi:hypothetical protein